MLGDNDVDLPLNIACANHDGGFFAVQKLFQGQCSLPQSNQIDALLK